MTLDPALAQEWAKKYKSQNWSVFPLPVGEKKPGKMNWQKIADELTLDGVDKAFAKGNNIGVVLTNDLVDLDLDSPEAVAGAQYFLPPTNFIFGRKETGLAHYVYYSPGAELLAFVDPVAKERNAAGEDVKAMLLEIRTSAGQYTMFPPGLHPSGQTVGFKPGQTDPEPTHHPFSVLHRRAHMLAAASLMARYWPTAGGRNEACLALCGGLVRAELQNKIDPKETEALVRCIITLGGNSDVSSDFMAIERTRKALDKDKKVKGWNTLSKLLGSYGTTVIERFREWLGIEVTSSASNAAGLLVTSSFGNLLDVQFTKSGPSPIKNEKNIAIILEHDPTFIGDGGEDVDPDGDEILGPIFYKEMMTGAKMVGRKVIWDEYVNNGKEKFEYPRPLENRDILELKAYLGTQWDFHVSKELVYDAVEFVSDRNRRNEIREYLESLVWDQQPRLNDMGHMYFSCPDDEWIGKVWRKWMISAVARIMRPGCKVDNAIILEGKQGIGKSTALAILAKKPNWFTDNHVDMSSKTGVETILGAWIVELSEITSLRRSEVETVKEFLSRTADKFRRPYARETEIVNRQCVFAGSVNPDGNGYLKDPTGDRRFWPIPCNGSIDFDGLREHVDQLWGEAVAAFHQGESWHVPRDTLEVDVLEGVQRARREKDPMEDPLVLYIKQEMERQKSPRILIGVQPFLISFMGYNRRESVENYRTQKVGAICAKLGFEKGRQTTFKLTETLRDGTEREYSTRSTTWWVREEQLLDLIDADADFQDLTNFSHPNHPGVKHDIPF